MKEEDTKDMILLKKRGGGYRIGVTAEMLAIISSLEAQGKAVMHFSKDSPAPRLLGAAMPPLEDLDMRRVDEFRKANPDFLPHEIYGKSLIAGHLAKGKKPFSSFDPQKLHFALTDEAGMRGDLDMEWFKLRLQFAPKHFPESNEMYGTQLHKYMEMELLKMPEAREKKPKYAPKPSRYSFLEGLQRGKKRY